MISLDITVVTKMSGYCIVIGGAWNVKRSYWVLHINLKNHCGQSPKPAASATWVSGKTIMKYAQQIVIKHKVGGVFDY